MKKALVIGIDEYPGIPLSGCINDARNVADLLERHESGEKNFDVKLEKNIKTKGEMIELIQSLFRGNAEIALFYFSGHGYMEERGGYVITPDFCEYDFGVSMADILHYANNSKCQNKIIFLDCCHSGALGMIPHSGTQVSFIGEGVTLLTASQVDESAVEVAGHGVFTNLLLGALRGGAANIQGKITPGSIYAYIDQALGGWMQRPVFKANICQFVSIRDVFPKVTYDEIRILTQCFATVEDEMQLDPSYEFTNQIEVEHEIIEPFAKEENVKIFKCLQRLTRVGLIEPIDTKHMYFAALESKKCKLTLLGKYYWELLKEGRM